MFEYKVDLRSERMIKCGILDSPLLVKADLEIIRGLLVKAGTKQKRSFGPITRYFAPDIYIGLA
jgi:hypothetical protein